MLLTIVAIWAIVIPLLVLAISWQAAKLRGARASQTTEWSVSDLYRSAARTGSVPACAIPAARPRRTMTRHVCPELSQGARRRPASA
jgi:hypothetical protein